MSVNNFADHIATILEGVGIPAASIKISTRATVPAGVGPFVMITPTSGAPNIRIHDDMAGYDCPSVQIRVHSKDFTLGWDMAKLAYTTLKPIRSGELEGVWYREIMVGPPPFDMGTDDTGRARVAFNAMAVKEPS